MRFGSRKHKDALLKQAEKLKGTGLYINERLTKKERRYYKTSTNPEETTTQDTSNVDTKWTSGDTTKWKARGSKGDHGMRADRLGEIRMKTTQNFLWMKSNVWEISMDAPLDDRMTATTGPDNDFTFPFSDTSDDRDDRILKLTF